MSQQGSYQITKIACSLEKEIDRLKAQVELFWDKELKHYIEYGLIDGMSIIEIGSGPGFVTEKLMDKFGTSVVTCVEIDPILVNYANEYLKQKNYTRFKIKEKSIMKMGLRQNTFDFAIVRLLLEHVPDPINAVREVFRVLKPGGKAVFIDNDFEMHIITYPQIKILRELYDAYCDSRCSEGGNPRIGRELPKLIKMGGFSNIDFEVIVAHSDLLGDEVFFKSEGIGIPTKLVQDGFLSSRSLAEISVEWRKMVRSGQHSFVRQLYMAVGQKLMQNGEV